MDEEYEIEVDMEKVREVIAAADLPADLKEKLLTDLPTILENVGEAAAVVYDPNKIWLEAIQYADYIQQHAEHLAQGHGAECDQDSIATILAMTISFKQMAENAMRVLDVLKVDSELVDWNEVKITYGEDNDAQQ
jgi:hypothetical protein